LNCAGNLEIFIKIIKGTEMKTKSIIVKGYRRKVNDFVTAFETIFDVCGSDGYFSCWKTGSTLR
jgi:hypothetical protein